MKKCLAYTSSSHNEFWRRHPALLKGLTLLIGTSSFLFWTPAWTATWIFLWALYLLFLSKKSEIFFLITALLYAVLLYGKMPTIDNHSGYFSITSLQPYQSPFQRGLIYQGSLYIEGKKFPCTARYIGKNRPTANCDYILKGNFIKQNPFQYLFKGGKWIPVKNTHSFAELRYQLKEKFRKLLNQKLLSPRTATFLSALITGDVEDRQLRYEFGKIGLQHILAISGFHFALLIMFCSFFLGLFLPFRIKIFTLLSLIILYFLFVGDLPAVQRSVLMAALYLIGKLIGRHSSSLNLLGVAILVEVLIDPLISSTLGFQLSFLSCFGILLFQPFFTSLLLRLFPKYDHAALSPLSQHAYLLSIYLRKAFTISLAVNIAILPLLLYHFHEFPLLSLIYNLFFPPLVSLALFLLLTALLLYALLPQIADPLFRLTDYFAAQLLDIASYPPAPLDYAITVASIAPWLIPLYLFTLFCLTNRPRLRYDFVS